MRCQSYIPDKQKMLHKCRSKGNNSNTAQGRVMVLMHCTLYYCNKQTCQVPSQLDISYAPDKELDDMPACHSESNNKSLLQLGYKNGSRCPPAEASTKTR